MDVFMNDYQSDWMETVKCPLSYSVEQSNELYETHKIGSVENSLCLRLFSSSLYEIANGSNDGRKLLVTIFDEKFLRKIEEQDAQIHESITQTVRHIAWKMRKAEILAFRRTSENHSWPSVRDILIKILSDGTPEKTKIATGISAIILQDVHRSHCSKYSIREELPLLPKNRFNQVFLVAVLLFNDSICDYILQGKKKSIYEMLATRMVYFYTRLAADTWRILVARNGPKVQTEWYMARTVEKIESEYSRVPVNNQPRSSNTGQYSNSTLIFNQNRHQRSTTYQLQDFFNPYPNQRPLRRNL